MLNLKKALLALIVVTSAISGQVFAGEAAKSLLTPKNHSLK